MEHLPSSIVNLNIIVARYAEIEAIKAEILAMQAENYKRRFEKLSDAYGESEFNYISGQLRDLSAELARL